MTDLERRLILVAWPQAQISVIRGYYDSKCTENGFWTCVDNYPQGNVSKTVEDAWRTGAQAVVDRLTQRMKNKI